MLFLAIVPVNGFKTKMPSKLELSALPITVAATAFGATT